MTGRELVSQIDSAIERRHLLKHRFYHKWQAGTLSRPKLQLYAAQYYWHVEAFPMHLKDLSGRTTGRLHDVVLENLAEEEDPAAPHAKLWRDFAASVGLNEESLWFSHRCLVSKHCYGSIGRSAGSIPLPKPSPRCTPTKRKYRKLLRARSRDCGVTTA